MESFMDFICGAMEGTLKGKEALLRNNDAYNLGVVSGNLSSNSEETTWTFRRVLAKAIAENWNKSEDNTPEKNCWKCIEKIQDTLSSLESSVDKMRAMNTQANELDDIFDEPDVFTVIPEKTPKPAKETGWHKRLPDNFLELASKVDAGEMTQCEAANICGISQPLFRYHMKKALKKAGK